MVTKVTACTIFPVASLPFSQKPSKTSFTGNYNFKVNICNPAEINTSSLKSRDGEVSSPSSSPSISFLKQLPDGNMLLNPTEIFEETKQTQGNDDYATLVDEFGTNSGRFVENSFVFGQNMSIRSYEIGADGKVSLEAFMNHLQEAGLNHMKLAGLLGDRLGSTPEMSKRKLFWVATKVQIVIDQYPTWGDNVVIDNRIATLGKNCIRHDSVILDCKTGQTLIRASSNWLMMNKETRRLSRIPEEVREKMTPFMKDATPIVEDDTNNLPKLDKDTSDSVVTGLKPRWSDLDINQHVNNTKYIGWVLESAPPAILENHDILRVTLEYRRECHRDDVLQSLTAIGSGFDCDFADLGNVECYHLLRLEGGAVVMKAKTEWKPRHVSIWKPKSSSRKQLLKVT